jgi:hypothetical protein
VDFLKDTEMISKAFTNQEFISNIYYKYE